MSKRAWGALGLLVVIAGGLVLYWQFGSVPNSRAQLLAELEGRTPRYRVAVVGDELGDVTKELPADFQRVSADELIRGEAVGANVVWFVGEDGRSQVLDDPVFTSMLRQLVLVGQPVVFVGVSDNGVALDLAAALEAANANDVPGSGEGKLYAVVLGAVRKDTGYTVSASTLYIDPELTEAEHLEEVLLRSYGLSKNQP